MILFIQEILYINNSYFNSPCPRNLHLISGDLEVLANSIEKIIRVSIIIKRKHNLEVQETH